VNNELVNIGSNTAVTHMTIVRQTTFSNQSTPFRKNPVRKSKDEKNFYGRLWPITGCHAKDDDDDDNECPEIDKMFL
jgi:hypothetical protein